MRDELAFVGGFEREAPLRPGAAELWAAGQGLCLPLWRGRVLLDGDGRLALLPPGHPAVRDAATLFLGRAADGTLRFAANLTDWPDAEIGPARDASGVTDPARWAHPQIADASFAELRSAMATLPPEEAALAATARALLNWHATHGFCANCGAPSRSSHGGWRRDCPACGTQHFPRTDPVVIMLVTRGNELLVGRSPGWPEGMYSLLAGFMEPGETISAAVAREVYEETAIRCGPAQVLASQPWPFPSSLMIGCRAEAETGPITLDPVELEDAFWISREDLADAFADRHPRMKPPRPGAIAAFLMKGWLADRRV